LRALVASMKSERDALVAERHALVRT